MERGAGGVKGLGRLFHVADQNRDQLLDLVTEMPKMMTDIGVVLNKTELTELVRLLDCDGTGKITYDQFMMIMAPPMNNERIKWVNRAFDQLDVDGVGRVPIATLEATHNPKSSEMIQMGTTTGNVILSNLFKSYDRDADGYISREEFTDYYREISPSVDNDEYFILMIKHAWGL
jgi:Ca2+-binding EF-hand superfamily protein